MNESTVLILLGLTGAIFGCLIKMKNLQDAANSANVNFNWKTYWKKDYIAIIASIISVLIWYGVFGEWEKKYPGITDVKRTLFVVAGYSGATVIQYAFDRFTNSAKKYITGYVDVKTNIADITTGIGKEASLDRVIEKGAEATGVDVTKAPPAPKEVIVPSDSDIKPKDV